MLNAILISRAGLADAVQRLDKAAGSLVKATTLTPPAPARDGAPVTGATGAPSGGSGDAASAFLDLMSAEMAFKANAAVMRTQAEMVRSLYDALD